MGWWVGGLVELTSTVVLWLGQSQNPTFDQSSDEVRLFTFPVILPPVLLNAGDVHSEPSDQVEHMQRVGQHHVLLYHHVTPHPGLNV